MGGKFSTDFKSSKQNQIILISSSVLDFLLIPGVPPQGGMAGVWIGVQVGMGVWGGVPCMHTCAHTHACTCML